MVDYGDDSNVGLVTGFFRFLRQHSTPEAVHAREAAMPGSPWRVSRSITCSFGKTACRCRVSILGFSVLLSHFICS